MAKIIFKYKLQVTDKQVIVLPKEHKVLSIQFQGEDLCLWAFVDTDSPDISKHIYIVPTGAPIDTQDIEGMTRFICTLQHPGVDLVWHIFEEWNK